MPQIIGSNLKALTVCIVYSSCLDKVISLNRISILVVNRTKLISFVVRPAYPYAITSLEVIWLGHLSNNEFHLEGSDFVEVYVVIGSGFRVKKTGVNLVWDSTIFIHENMVECEPIPYTYFCNTSKRQTK